MSDLQDEPRKFGDPNYNLADFKRELTAGRLRWVATVLAVVNLGAVIWFSIDPKQAIAYFPIRIQGMTVTIVLYATLVLWSALAAINWRNRIRRTSRAE